MNRSNMRQKRSVNKGSPLNKRPKLDFTLKTKETISGRKEETNGFNESLKDYTCDSDSHRTNFDSSGEPDWDDEFSGDMLEKVCLIADLSQAMINNQGKHENVDNGKCRDLNERKTITESITKNSKISDELEKLKLELRELQEKFKTKEGEVHILRSQLKQNDDAKQAAAVQSMKVIEEIQRKFNEKISSTEKELETTKTKLQFKDMEYKTLSERCRQIEYNLSDSCRVVDGAFSQAPIAKKFAISQSFAQKEKEVKSESNSGTATTSATTTTAAATTTITTITTSSSVTPKAEILQFEIPIETRHEGKLFSNVVCPEIFQFIEEPSVIPLYTHRTSEVNYPTTKLDFDKRERYRWSDMPKQSIFIKDIYESVSSLFLCENFNQKNVVEKTEKIIEYCIKILDYYKKLLLFLEKLNLQMVEHDDSDQTLLENEDEVKLMTLKNLLEGKKIVAEEYGIEARRTLAIICALMSVSNSVTASIKKNSEFFFLLKDLASAVGNLRRPIRYTGILVGTAFILQRILEERDVNLSTLTLISETVEEIIFARPKLDVLREIVNALAAGSFYLEFQKALCRKASLESCALYMDSKLKQAMFFTRDACPLKILCMQIMGLASLSSSKGIRWDLTKSIIKWLNSSINTPHFDRIKWLPTNLLVNEEDRCFDVTECLVYLLCLCLEDYNRILLPRDYLEEKCAGGQASYLDEDDANRRKNNLISIIGQGAVLVKRVLKTDQRQLHDNVHSLRFAVLLKGLLPGKSDLCQRNHMSCLSSVATEAITWIADSLTVESRNQDNFLKQNTSVLSEHDIVNALRISDKSLIY